MASNPYSWAASSPAQGYGGAQAPAPSYGQPSGGGYLSQNHMSAAVTGGAPGYGTEPVSRALLPPSTSQNSGPSTPSPAIGGAQNGTAPSYGQQPATGQQNYGPQPVNSDFQNANGSWHMNPSYGQGGGGGGGGGGNSSYGSSLGQGVQGPTNSNTFSPAAGAPNFASYMPSAVIGNYDDQNFRQRQSAESNALLPWAQLQQNQYQYGNDAAENARRFDETFGQQGQAQQWQQNFSEHQQTQAEQQAALAAQQWQSQFGQQVNNDQWSQNFQEAQAQAQGQAAAQQFGLQSQVQLGQLGQAQQQIDNSLWGQQQQWGQNQQQISNQNQQFNQTYNQQNQQFGQQLGFQQAQQNYNQSLSDRQFNLSQQQSDQNYGLGQRNMSLQELANQQQYGLSSQQMANQQAQAQQQYGLNVRSADLASLTQQQQNAYQNAALSQSGSLGNRSLDLQSSQQQQQAAYQTAQLAQAHEAAYLQATGRNQAQNAHWLRAT